MKKLRRTIWLENSLVGEMKLSTSQISSGINLPGTKERPFVLRDEKNRDVGEMLVAERWILID